MGVSFCQALEQPQCMSRRQHVASENQIGTNIRFAFSLFQVISFLKKNVLLTGGFVGGFLLGMAS